MKKQQKVIIIGGGLAGLSCASELVECDFSVTLYEASPFLGGRTSSWNENGMEVELGLHRFLGFYEELPRLLNKSGVNVNDIIFWEDEIIIKLKGGISGKFGLAPFYKPFRTLAGFLGNSHIISFREKLSFIKLISSGIWDYVFNKSILDSITIEEYASVTLPKLEQV